LFLASLFQPSLIFVCKAGSYPVIFLCLHPKGWLLSLRTRLSIPCWKGLPTVKPLAHLSPPSVTKKKKRFKTYAGHWRQDNKLECLSLANIFQPSQSYLYTAASKMPCYGRLWPYSLKRSASDKHSSLFVLRVNDNIDRDSQLLLKKSIPSTTMIKKKTLYTNYTSS
jgi:hypothetical protein